MGRLPLTHHCADVAAVVEALLIKGAISHRLALLGGLDSLTPELTRALVRTAFLHDVGKCNRGFQAKAITKAERERLGVRTAGHVREIAPFLNSTTRLHREVMSLVPALGPFIAPGRPERQVLLAAASHHGDPLREGALLDPPFRNAIHLWQPGDGSDGRAA